jgi:hypothetical protein
VAHSLRSFAGGRSFGQIELSHAGAGTRRGLSQEKIVQLEKESNGTKDPGYARRV